MPKTLPRRKEGTKIYRHQPHPPANQRDNPSNKMATNQKQNNPKPHTKKHRGVQPTPPHHKYKNGGPGRDRTCDHRHVKAASYH